MTKIGFFVLSLCALAISISGDTVTTALRRRLDGSESTPVETVENKSPVTTTSNKGRPKMHAFFTPVSANPDTSLLDVWKKAWSDVGWEPVVLTLEDARKHPDYRRFIEAFESA